MGKTIRAFDDYDAWDHHHDGQVAHEVRKVRRKLVRQVESTHVDRKKELLDGMDVAPREDRGA